MTFHSTLQNFHIDWHWLSLWLNVKDDKYFFGEWGEFKKKDKKTVSKNRKEKEAKKCKTKKLKTKTDKTEK